MCECISDIHTTTQSPNDTFLKSIPVAGQHVTASRSALGPLLCCWCSGSPGTSVLEWRLLGSSLMLAFSTGWCFSQYTCKAKSCILAGLTTTADWFRVTWFCHVSKVPALLESQVEEKTDSEGAGSSECSDAESEEQGDGACSKKPSPDLDVDRKVSQEHRLPCALLWQHGHTHFSLSKCLGYSGWNQC